jgi:hypothetical protein
MLYYNSMYLITMASIMQFLLQHYKPLWIQLFLTHGSQSHRAYGESLYNEYSHTSRKSKGQAIPTQACTGP